MTAYSFVWSPDPFEGCSASVQRAVPRLFAATHSETIYLPDTQLATMLTLSGKIKSSTDSNGTT